MHRLITTFLVVVALIMTATTSSATTLSTNFVGGTIGAQPTAGDGISAALAAITNFGGPNTGVTAEPFDGTPNLGQIAFLNNGSFYVSSNRAYGFAGPGRSDITFDPNTVSEVTIDVRGSDGQSTGGNSAVDPTAPNTILGTSDVTLLIWSNVGVQSTTTTINNNAFQSISLDVDTVPGDFITRISLINNSTDANSVALIGLIDVTLVPEPSSIMLLGLSGIAMVLRRRR